MNSLCSLVGQAPYCMSFLHHPPPSILPQRVQNFILISKVFALANLSEITKEIKTRIG